MNMKRIMALGFLVAATPTFGLSSSDLGTSNASFLKIGPGARPGAMGEAFSAVADDVHAVSYNPAGLAETNRWEVTGMRSDHFQGIDYDYIAAAIPLGRLRLGSASGKLGAAGLALQSLSAGGLERRATMDLDAPAGSFSASDLAFSMAYAHALGRGLSAGAALKFLRQTVDGVHESDVAADLGLLHRLGGGWNIGYGVRHLGAAPLPTTGFAAAAFRPSPSWLLSLDLGLPRDLRPTAGLGAEFTVSLPAMARASLRAGFLSRDLDAEGWSGVRAGLGLGLGAASFDFAWVPMGELGNAFRYSLSVKY